MALEPSGAIVQPTGIVSVLAQAPDAKAAFAVLVMGPGRSQTILDLSHLGDQRFGPLGTVIVNNTENTDIVTVIFPDTGDSTDVPAGEKVYILVVTGSKQIAFMSTPSALKSIPVQVLNFIAAPTGVQPVSGSIVVAGDVVLLNPPPYTIFPSDHTSAALSQGVSTQIIGANSGRKYLRYQMPTGSDGWVNDMGLTAGPAGLNGSIYFVPGGSYESQGTCTGSAVNVYLVTAGGVVPVSEA
jgi:hypothetical protein